MSVSVRKSRNQSAAVLLLWLSPLAIAQVPLPDLHIEPIGGGTAFTVKNTATQPITAYFIELVGYPGSSYVLIQDDIESPIPPGGQKRLPVGNMIPGAAPDYVKMQAAIYADGSSSGIPDKVAQIIEHRRLMLETTREAVQRLEKAKVASSPKDQLIADLKQWDASIPEPVHKYRFRPKELNQTDTKAFITDIARKLETQPIDSVLAGLLASEHAMAASRPAL